MASGSSSSRMVSSSRRKAEVWNDFIEHVVENKKMAECKNCGQHLVAGSNSTLRRHIESCKKKHIPEDEETETFRPEGSEWVFDQMRARLEGMQMVVREGLPFNLLERPNVVNWIRNCLQPQWEKVSRTTLKRDAIKNWNQIKKDSILFYENYAGRVALTCDIWSTPHNLVETYICITCHHVDIENWQMVKRTIAFESLPHPHTGERIHNVIASTINEYKIQNKIMTISFDNASNNDNAIGRLKEDLNGPCNNLFLHGRCVCHILNLVVCVVLEGFKDILDKFRRMNRFIFKSGKTMAQQYHAFCKSKGVRRLKGEMDMPIRWNSTYKMLQRLLKQREVLSSFYDIYNKSDDMIFDSDWKIIIDLVDLLQVFFEASKILSGVYYPTSCLVLPQIVLICHKLSEYRSNDDYATTIYAMISKLMKYFTQIPAVFTISTALHPLYNKQKVLHLIDLLEDAVGNEFFKADENIAFFEESFESFFRYYKNINMPRNPQPQNPSNVAGSSKTGKSIFGLLSKPSNKRTRTSSTTIDEFSVYCSNLFSSGLDEDYIEFNVLQWWQGRKNEYPILAIMARDILTVQASTVASESCFSLSGRIISDRRTRLTPESVELCICLKDYLDSVDRVQDSRTLEDSALDGLEEDLVSGSEQTSYTSGTEEQSYNIGSNDYIPEIDPDAFRPFSQQTFQQHQPFPQHLLQPPQQQQQQQQDWQPFQPFVQPPHQFQSFYNTEDLFQRSQFQQFRRQDNAQDSDDDND